MSQRRILTAMAIVPLWIGLVGCVPDPGSPPPTRLAVLTQLTWCGGVIPPPGEPACHTAPTATAITVYQGRAVVASGVTGSDGRLDVEVAAGTYVVAAASPEAYMDCDHPTVVAVVGAATSVTQTCTVMAP